MASQNLRLIFTQSAWDDLEQIVAYWAERGEPERGVQYAHDLPGAAMLLLGDPDTARRGRYLVNTAYPEAQELPVFRRTYRILYHFREDESVVEILRFWHSHRREPFL
ncbi:type II toxin-antitoxin system RelE/ParE family toxin [Opitutaceae bacterium TAV4]|uniref:type II toxin-antitoxin system RelE/ParE family toxin n=1 Tax=Geminisphaera colitermitum TaxID=1148786 RepID=UPI000158D2EA|nr:type II toxin-antitoxin system RelE/ParE family toxin [Geminisphaera colitermitum]RRJ94580.1 type II toxin-antitoxin system RelE/ParE family toxin [Opitutaceae bacterium TAV4]RRJ98643.1 type II toxin-antitoxin system RelE/ParE family toxin [Opitutaceae bacterium TAV3]